MTKVYSTETSALILEAIQNIELGNNGYADIGNNADVIEAVQIAGYTVIPSRNAWGNRTHKGYTPKGMEAARKDGKLYVAKPNKQNYAHEFDYEGAILRRQENAGFYDL